MTILPSFFIPILIVGLLLLSPISALARGALRPPPG
jgi:hypothetical protein